MWGITQHVIDGGKVKEEWMMFNEFEVMQQIYRDDPVPLATGNPSDPAPGAAL
jgi:hypothetical protein